MLVATFATLCFGAAASGCDTQQLPTGIRADLGAPHDSALVAVADAHINNGSSGNSNFGTATNLRVQGNNPRYRSLVRFDGQAAVAAIGAESLLSARLELTIQLNAGGWQSGGTTIAVHRMTTAWTETAVTWSCPHDTNLQNSVFDCDPWWEMGSSSPPFVTTATASAPIVNGQTGVMVFDVTADVRLWQTGGSNHGWIVKRSVDGSGTAGGVDYGSRESTTKPKLILTLASADTTPPPIPATFADPHDSTKAGTRAGEPEDRRYRHILDVGFTATATGVQIRALFQKYAALVIGGYPRLRVYTIQIPDPGSIAAADSIKALVAAEPGVRMVRLTPYSQGTIKVNGRFPRDGSSFGASRSDWLGSGTDVTLRLLRARDGFSVWAGSFDADSGDAMSIAQRLAVDAARAIEETVVREDTLRI